MTDEPQTAQERQPCEHCAEMARLREELDLMTKSRDWWCKSSQWWARHYNEREEREASCQSDSLDEKMEN